MECPGWGHLTWTVEDGLSQSPIWGHFTCDTQVALSQVAVFAQLQDASGLRDSIIRGKLHKPCPSCGDRALMLTLGNPPTTAPANA